MFLASHIFINVSFLYVIKLSIEGRLFIFSIQGGFGGCLRTHFKTGGVPDEEEGVPIGGVPIGVPIGGVPIGGVPEDEEEDEEDDDEGVLEFECVGKERIDFAIPLQISCFVPVIGTLHFFASITISSFVPY